MMLLLGPLSLALLGAGSVLGSPLVARSPQSSSTTGTNQNENPPPTSSSPSPGNENGLGLTVQRIAPWLVAGVGIPVAGTVGALVGRQQTSQTQEWRMASMQVEMQRLRQQIDEARRAGVSADHLIFEKDGYRMNLVEVQHYMFITGDCRGSRVPLLYILKGNDLQPILDHLGETEISENTAKKIEEECSRDVIAWFKAGRPKSGNVQHKVWDDAHKAARHYDRRATRMGMKIRGRRHRGTEETDPSNMAFSLDSATELVSNIPLAARRFSSSVQREVPGMMQYAAARLASGSRMTLQHVQRPKIAVPA